MTLIRNNKELNLFKKTDKFATSELKKFREKFPWFNTKVGLKINMAKRFKRPSRIPHNVAQGIIDKPASIGFACKFDTMTEDGPVSLMYCERYKTNDLGGVIDPYPNRFRITDDMTISWAKIDFAYFLYQHTGCGNGPNFNSSVMGEVFRIEEPEQEAADALEIELLMTNVHSLILHEPVDRGLDRDELERMATLYGIKNIYNGMPKKDKQLRQDILQILKIKARNNGVEKEYNLFMKNLDRRDEAEALSDIDFAIEVGILKLKGLRPGDSKLGNMAWSLFGADGELIKRFAIHRKTSAEKDHREPLLDAFKDDAEIHLQFQQAVEREKEAVT